MVATRPRLPHSEPAKERIGVAAQPAVLPSPAAEARLLQLLGVPSADDDVIEEKRGREPFHPERDRLAPLLLPELLEPASSYVVLDGPFPVREGPELHRHDVPAHHEGGAETRPETKEEHRSTLVAPEGLHRGIVDDLDGTTKRCREIEPDPAVGEVAGFGDRSVSDNLPGVADGNHVVLPIPGELQDTGDHPARRQVFAGRELSRFSLASRKNLHVGSPDVDRKNPRRCFHQNSSTTAT